MKKLLTILGIFCIALLFYFVVPEKAEAYCTPAMSINGLCNTQQNNNQQRLASIEERVMALPEGQNQWASPSCNYGCQQAYYYQSLVRQLCWDYACEDAQIIDNGDGTFTTICTNGVYNTWGNRNPPPPPPPPPPPQSCGQPCTSDQACVTYDQQGGGGCTKCIGFVPPDCSSLGPGYQLIQLGASYYCQDSKSTVPAPGGGGQGTCQAPPQNSPTPSPTAGPTSTPVPTSTPAPTSTPVPTSTPRPTATPVPTATPTPVPACGLGCSNDYQCAGARDGCTACVNNTCKTPPACGVTCNQASDCGRATDGCTSCFANKCVPPFSTQACHCDNLEIGNLASGQQATITAYAKVEGAQDVSRAKIVSQKFTLYAGSDTSSTILLSANIPTTKVIDTPTLVRYKSVWTFTVPQLESGKTYRIGVVADDANTCQEKSSPGQALNYSPDSRHGVLGAADRPWYCSIPFIAGLLGCPNISSSNLNAPSTTSGTAVVNVQESNDTVGTRNNLQLDTFTPIEIVQKLCNYVIFKVL